MRLRVKSFVLGALTLTLADTYTISSITSKELGRLLFLRVRNQNGVVVNLPSPLSRDYELTLTVHYQGRIERQSIDSESIGAGPPPQRPERPADGAARAQLAAEQPRALVPAAGRHRLRPRHDARRGAARVRVAASGVAASTEPTAVAAAPARRPGSWLYTFAHLAPGALPGRGREPHGAGRRGHGGPRHRRAAAAAAAAVGDPGAAAGAAQAAAGRRPQHRDLVVMGNRRQENRARDALATTADIFRFYASLMGDAPYPAFSVAMLESDLPGGHSPAYFAVLNNPLPTTPFVWRNDPATFSDFPEFFLAHEVAHQWWGQAVGWKNYHEQWISEGFAQYFAALYASEKPRRRRVPLGAPQPAAVVDGALGSGADLARLPAGHVKGEPRVFRARGLQQGRRGAAHAAPPDRRRGLLQRPAAVLRRPPLPQGRHRRPAAGDGGGQRPRRSSASSSAGSSTPRCRGCGSRRRPRTTALEVAYEQLGEIFDLPVTVTLQYADGTSEDVVVVMTRGFGLRSGAAAVGALRSVEVNRDDAALGTFERR